MIDFEQAVINAFLYHFPSIIIKLCFFHFGQNVFKKIVEIGLKRQYKEDDELKLWVKKVIALALIPPSEIPDAFVRLSEEEIVDNYELGEFLDYITINYVDDPLFPIEYWNHWDNEDDRTNNKVEGYNHKLNNFLNTHPNIWKFIMKIKSEETTSNLAYTRIDNGTYKHRRRNKIDLERDLQITKLKLKFIEKKLDVDELLSALSSIIHDSLKD